MIHNFWFHVGANDYSMCFIKSVELPSIVPLGLFVDVDDSGDADFEVTDVALNINQMSVDVTLTQVADGLTINEVVKFAQQCVKCGWTLDGEGVLFTADGSQHSLEALSDRFPCDD